MNDATIHIPVTATYRIIDGEPVMIDAEYADVPADTVARLFLQAFNVPVSDNAVN